MTFSESPPFSTTPVAIMALVVGVPALAGLVLGGVLVVLVRAKRMAWWTASALCTGAALLLWGAAFGSMVLDWMAARTRDGNGWTQRRRGVTFLLVVLQALCVLAALVTVLAFVLVARAEFELPWLYSMHVEGTLIVAVSLPVFYCSLLCFGVPRLWITRQALRDGASDGVVDNGASDGVVDDSYVSFSSLATSLLPGAGRSVTHQPSQRLVIAGASAIVLMHFAFSIAAISLQGFDFGNTVAGLTVWAIVTLQLPSWWFVLRVLDISPVHWTHYGPFALLLAIYVVYVSLAGFGHPRYFRQSTAIIVLSVIDFLVMIYMSLWFLALNLPSASPVGEAAAQADAAKADALAVEAVPVEEHKEDIDLE